MSFNDFLPLAVAAILLNGVEQNFAILVDGIMGNIRVKLFEILTIVSGNVI